MVTPVRQLAAALAVMYVMAAGYSGAAAAWAGAASKTPCTPDVTTIDGGLARIFCGPARATATVGKTTYRFASGSCRHTRGFAVNVGGTLVIGSSEKLSYFGISLPGAAAGSYRGTHASLAIVVGRRHVSLSRAAGSRVVLDEGLHSGTFVGTDLSGRTIKGSFSC
jgi:hypothetical protein